MDKPPRSRAAVWRHPSVVAQGVSVSIFAFAILKYVAHRVYSTLIHHTQTRQKALPCITPPTIDNKYTGMDNIKLLPQNKAVSSDLLNTQ